MSIYYMRHGQTQWNLEKKAQGISDIELNEKGIMQAMNARDKASKLNIDLIICSPLKRARRTAEIIKEVTSAEIIENPSIIERNFGKLEGELVDDEMWVDMQSKFMSIGSKMDIEDFEQFDDLFARAKNAIDKILEDHKDYKDKNILIVGHGVFYDALRMVCSGEDYDMKYELDNCDIVEIPMKNIE